MPSSPSAITCPICSKTYSRSDHLQRHLQAHSPTFPYQCSKCKKSFKRSDVLKRHREDCLKTCFKRALPTRHRACSRCVAQKRRCNFQQPCSNCVNTQASCIYRPCDPHAPLFNKQTQEIARLPPEAGREDDVFQPRLSTYLILPAFGLDADPAQSFPFLLEFTKDLSLPYSFENGVVIENSLWVTQGPSMFGQLDIDIDLLDHSLFQFGDIQIQDEDVATSLSDDSSQLFLDGSGLQFNNESSMVSTLSPFDETSWQDDPLGKMIFPITQMLGAATDDPKSRGSVWLNQSTPADLSSFDFFSPPKLRKFLDLYWTMWYPNWPTVHKPLFDPLHTSPLLLAAMSIMGACHSTDPRDQRDSNVWADRVEKLVFDELSSANVGMSVDGRKTSIQLIQAACVMCIYQHWNGTNESKRRMRRERFTALVGACRDMDISRAVHRDYRFVSQADFNWRDFAETEEMIRTFIWVFMIDTAFVTFNNAPPRMVLAELKMDLACPEKCFQASTAEDCFLSIQWWLCKTRRNQTQRPSSLFDFIRAFCGDELDQSTRDCYAHEAYINHFAVPSALQILIFNLSTGMLDDLDQRLVQIRRALKNWRAVWNCRLGIDRSNTGSITSFDVSIEPEAEAESTKQSEPEKMLQHRQDWRRPGFWRHASEYWLLSRMFVDRLESSRDGTASEELSCRNTRGNHGERRISHRYDETDMTELHRFLSSCAR